MHVHVSGASGLIGRRLSDKLRQAGDNVHALPRRVTPEGLAGADAVVHLAGEPVAQRWTPDVKQRIYDSRVEGTRTLVTALEQLPRRPEVLVCASAIGIYGSRGDEILTEASSPANDFLARACIDWESAARSAEGLGIRAVQLRFGMVLGPGGALEKMLLPFRLGLGGRLGSGDQWVSWIHIDDAVALIQFALEHASVHGPMNATAPNPLTNAQFTRALAQVLHRPAIFAVPEFALRFVYGEMADVVMASERVIPAAAQSAGFQFKFPDLTPALTDLLAK